jgi:signal transduction histidine kinase
VSIRVRLTLWYVVILCLGFAVFGIAVFWQTQQTANAAFDESLRERASELRAYVQFSPHIRLLADAPDEGAGTPGEAAAWIRILDAHGRVAATEGPPLANVPQRLLATTVAGFYDVGNLHMFVQPLLLHGKLRAVIQTITTGQELGASSRRLLSAMLVVGVFTLVLAALAGLFLANRALRPVDRITRVAQEIGDGDLRRRVAPQISERSGRGPSGRDEIGRLALTFDAMLSRLEHADGRRRQLTADAAHELATPVATIMTGAEIALRRRRTPDEYRDALHHVVEESQHLARLVDDLLFLARADAGRLHIMHELVEIDEVCRQVVAAMEPLARKRDISLELALPVHSTLVQGDEMRLGQVIRNLLDNGVRYTPSGGTVRLSVERGPRETGVTGEIAIHVEDSGPGIPVAERERVFERFHRVVDVMRAPDTDSDRTTGSGLGLAICKAIVAAHGGWIRVEDTDGSRAIKFSTGAHVAIGLPSTPE